MPSFWISSDDLEVDLRVELPTINDASLFVSTAMSQETVVGVADRDELEIVLIAFGNLRTVRVRPRTPVGPSKRSLVVSSDAVADVVAASGKNPSGSFST
jgi:hypothetical protein